MSRPRMSREMLERLGHNQLPPPALTNFDDTDAVPAASTSALMGTDQNMHKDVVLIALLEGWCQANGKSDSKSQRLYKRMCVKLVEMKIISPAFLDTVRLSGHSFGLLLDKLVSFSLSSSSDDSIDGHQARAVVPFQSRCFLQTHDADMASFFPERYEKDFEEIKRIGLGGFGKVYRARNRLEEKDYAIKKIKVKQKKPNFMAMQREIQTLAGLNHSNVVRYHTSWFGEEDRRIKPSARPRHNGIPSLESPEMQRQRNETGNHNSNGSGSEGDDDEDGGDEDDGDEDDGDEDDEWEEEQEENEADDENSHITRPGTKAVTTELNYSEVKNQIRLTKTKQSHTSATPFDSEDNFEIMFEEERFDSTELVGEFLEKTIGSTTSSSTTLKSEYVRHSESYSTITSNIDMSHDATHSQGLHYAHDKQGHSLNHSEESGSSELPTTDCEENGNNNRGSQTDATDSCEKLDITKPGKNHIFSSSILLVDPNIPVSAVLWPNTTNSLRNMHARGGVRARQSRQGGSQFRRSVSLDGSDCSPQSAQGIWPPPPPLPREKRRFLYIQMELCCSNLNFWMQIRNNSTGDLNNQFDAVKDTDNKVIMKQILEGMSYIHSKGILHRDVTPKNIFLDGGNGSPLHVKIGDFGLAREDATNEPKTPLAAMQPEHDCSMPCESQCHTSGVGTATYASPEQLNGNNYDNKSDMFSIGLIIFEMYHPFKTAMERDKCLKKLREGDIPDEIQDRWPEECTAIQRLIHQDSHERPSADDLLHGKLFPSKDEIIANQESEIARLRALLAKKDAQISELKDTQTRSDTR